MKKRSILWMLILCLCVSMLAVTVSAAKTTTPDAPVVTAANIASSGKIRLTWEPVENAVKYEVYRSETRKGEYTRLITTSKTAINHNSAEAEKLYYYYVVAVASDGTKSEKSAVVYRTCDLAQPTVTLSNIASTGKITVSWNKIDGAVKYQVYRSCDGGSSYDLLITTSKTSINNTSAVAGEKYRYKVRAIAANTNANSAYSSVKDRTCDLAQPTLSVSNIASSGKIKLSWNKIDGAVNYRVYMSQDKENWTTLKTVTGTSLNHTSAVAGETYYYKVRALSDNSAANSADSAVKIRACDLPQPVVTVETEGDKASGDYDIDLVWDAVTGAQKYEIRCFTNGSGTYETVETTLDYFEHYYAERGNVYTYQIRAIARDSAANSAWTEVRAVCPLAIPEISISLNDSGKPVVSWQSIAGAEKYEVYYSADYGANYSLLKTVTGRKLTHSSAKQNRTYCYIVKAIPANEGVEPVFTDMVFINCSCVSIDDSKLQGGIVNCINTYREYYGLGTLSWNEWGENGAKIRAAELNKSYSVNRPNGDPADELWMVYDIAYELDFQADASVRDVVDALMMDEELAGLLMYEDWAYVVAARNGDYWTVMFS